MVWFIAKKEFRNNIVTPGFIVGLLLCLALIPYTVYTGIRTHTNRLAQYEVDIKTAEDIYMKAHTYAQVNPILVKPVSSLSIFSKGITEQTGSKVKLDRKEKPVFSTDIVSLNENPLMSKFMSMDFAMAIAILLSLLGILFSYDMLSREKEQGTLKLALSHPVSRSTFFLGKIAGIFLTLTPILVICFLVILLIIQLSPSVQFSSGDYGRIGALLLLSLIYFGFFVFLGGFISSRTKSSTASIILNLFIWCILLFLLPNTAAWFGKNISPTDDYRQVDFYTDQIDKQWWDVQAKEVEEILKNENLNLFGWAYCWDMDWDGAHATMFTPRESMEYERRKKELANPILLANCNKKWAIQSDYLQQIYRQEKTVRYLSCLSPAGILKLIATSLCRTGTDSEVHFMDQARQFQDMFYGYFVQNKIFSSYAYFTPQKESEFPNDWDESNEQAARWREEAKATSTFDFNSIAYQDTQSFPRFAYVQPTLGDDLFEQLYLIAGILIMCILLFWLSFMSFIKYDVR
ncbi:MAG: ABC transporter permease subunit [Dysgonamonadaceae bacterium]|jgi:ABC-type transport system involved in multi-copper enzyme maturation permease subunit|nr:ABC transporter permease subunit [Dysgonamonadaceae bacterium]